MKSDLRTDQEVAEAHGLRLHVYSPPGGHLSRPLLALCIVNINKGTTSRNISIDIYNLISKLYLIDF